MQTEEGSKIYGGIACFSEISEAKRTVWLLKGEETTGINLWGTYWI